MKRRMIILVALLGMTAVPAGAQAPAETPFPSPKIVGTFVRVRTVTAPNSAYLTNFFPHGAPVVFRMFVGDNKTGHSLTNKDLRYARIAIPGQPSLKMKYVGDDPLWPWVGPGRSRRTTRSASSTSRPRSRRRRTRTAVSSRCRSAVHS